MIRHSIAIVSLVAGASVVLALPLGAQSPSSAAADVREFARALSSHGYADLAREVVAASMEGKAGSEKAELELSLLEAQSEDAKRERDLPTRVKRLREAAETFEGFVKSNPDHPQSAELRFTVADLYRIAGEQAVAAVGAESDAAKRDQLRAEGLAIFGKAITLTEDRIGKLQGLAQKSEREEYEFQALRFASGKLYYSQAMIHENRQGSGAQVAIQQAKTILEEFEIDVPDQLLTFEARKILGQIAMEESRPDDAYEKFHENCAVVLEALANDFVPDEASKEVFASAFLEKAKFLLGVRKDGEEAIRTLEEIHSKLPSLMESRDGRQALTVLADTYLTEGHPDKAKKLAEKIVAADPGNLRSREILEKAGPGEDSAGQLTALEAAVSQKDVARAEKISARILSGKGPEDRADVLFFLGQVYYDTGRPVDAAVCFRGVSEDYPKSPRASAAKLNEALSYAQAYRLDASGGGGKDPAAQFWKSRYATAQKELGANFPESPEAKEVAYVQGLEAESDGRLEEAVTLFLKVLPTSVKYGDAQQKAGKNLLVLAQESANRNLNDEAKTRFGKAEQALGNVKPAIERLKKIIINESELKRLSDTAFNAQLQLAGLFLQPMVKKPERCIELLGEVEKDAKDEKDKIRKIWDLRIKAFVQMGQGRQAGELLEKFLAEAKQTGGAGAGAEAALSVAAAIDAQALEKSKANAKDPEAAVLWKEAGKWYRRAVEEGIKGVGVKPDAWEKIGMRLMFISGSLMGLPDPLPLFSIEPATTFNDKESKETVEKAFEALQMSARSTQEVKSPQALMDRTQALARCAALLGRWQDALTALQAVTQKYPLFKEHRLDPEAQKTYRTLPSVYADMAVASIRTGQTKKETFYFEHAAEVVSDLLGSSERNSRLYWECRYLNLLVFYGSGKYDLLKDALASLDRTSPEVDGNTYGIKDKITALKKECERKLASR